MLEVILAFLVVFVLYSSMVSAIVELVNNSNFRQKRQMYLFKSIGSALNDPNSLSWGSLIYRHQQIATLKNRKRRYPVYISASTFANALLGVLKEHDFRNRLSFDLEKNRLTISDLAIDENIPASERDAKRDENSYEYYKRVIESLDDGKFKQLLISFLTVHYSKEEERMKLFKGNIEEWFDNYQDRVVGAYKKSIRRDLFWFGWGLAVILNINLLSISDSVLNDSDLRSSLIGTAEQLAQNYREQDPIECDACSDDEFDKRYEDFLNSQVTLIDSTVTWFQTSGLPVFWEIPLTSSQRRIRYLKNKSARLRQIKEDTLDAILGRYCLLNNFLKGHEDSIHFASIDFIQLELDSMHSENLRGISRKYGLTYQEEYTKNVIYSWKVISDSINIKECLPEHMRVPYGNCLTDCSCVDRILLQDKVLGQLDDRIRNYTLEAEIHAAEDTVWDQVFAYLGVFSYNLRDGRDILCFLLGTLLMALIGAEGTATWFKLLLRLVDIRFAGIKPAQTKKDNKAA